MTLSDRRIAELETLARNLRRTVLEMVYAAGSGHMGGSLSCADILVALYMEHMKFNPKCPKDPNRDRFILSKGHAAPALYAILAHLGLVSRSELTNLRKYGCHLQGHPDMKSVPGVEMSSGPLGLGLSAGLGMALAARLDNRTYTTYVLMGDGELQEGIVWEAAMAAAKYRAANLIAIVDWNGVQLDGEVNDIMPLGDLEAKFRSFGWNTIKCDGHSIPMLCSALDEARACDIGPTVILAKTVKGKGISFMEGKSAWHGRPVDEQSYRLAAHELGGIAFA